MINKGLSHDELLQVQGWLTGVLWDIRHGYVPHASSTLIQMIKGIQCRTESFNPDAFRDWPDEALTKIQPYVFR